MGSIIPASSFSTRDRDASRPHRRRPRSTTYAQSSSSPSRPKRKAIKAPVEETDAEIYATKDQAVLAEKKKDGRILLLVNWADHPKTGETYEPTWEPCENVLPAGRAQWKRQKREGLVVERGGEFVLKDPDHDEREKDAEQEDTTAAIERTKRKRVDEDSDEISQSKSQPYEAAHLTKRRRSNTADPTHVALVSQSERESSLEVKDSYEEELLRDQDLTDRKEGQPHVEISIPPGFDRSAYKTPVVDSSQSQDSNQIFQNTQDSQASRSLEDLEDLIDSSEPEALPSKRLTRSAAAFVIPDSQDLRASESYGFTQLSNSSTAYSTQGTAQDLESDLSPLAGHERKRPGERGSVESSIEEVHDGIDVTYHERDISIIESQSNCSLVPTGELRSPVQEGFNQIGASISHPGEPLPSTSTEHSSQLLTPTRESRDSQDRFDFSSSPNRVISTLNQDRLSNSQIQSQSQLLSPSVETRSVKSISPDPLISPTKRVSARSSIESTSRRESLSIQFLLNEEDHSLPSQQGFLPQSSAVILPSQKSNPTSPTQSTWQAAQLVSSAVESPNASVLDLVPSLEEAEKQPTDQPLLPSLGVGESVKRTETSIPKSVQRSDVLLQSIEIGETLTEDTIASTHKSQPFIASQSSSPPRMDEALKLARRAERRRALEQKLKDDRDRAIAEYTARTSVMPPSPSQVPTLASVNNEPVQVFKSPESVPFTLMNEGFLSEQAHIHPLVKETLPPLDDEQHGQEPISEIEQLELEDNSPLLDVVAETDNEHFLSLPLNAICRDIYSQIIASARKERQTFLQDESFDQDLLIKISNMFSSLDVLCNHSDLHSDDFSTQRMDSVALQARYAENKSTKCMIIAEIVQAMQDVQKHIAIIVRPGRMLEILGSIFEYHDFIKQDQVDHVEYRFKDLESALRVSLIPSGTNNCQLAAADLVFAFDSTFSREPYLESLRSKPQSPGLTPLVYLIIANSIEHLEKLFPKAIEDVERRIRIVGCLSVIRDDVGKVEFDPERTASDIARFVRDGASNLDWPCQPLPVVEIAQEYAGDIRSSSSATPSNQSLADGSVPATLPISLLSTAKRQLEDDDNVMDTDTPKRQRLTPTPGTINSPLPATTSSSTPLVEAAINSLNHLSALQGAESQPFNGSAIEPLTALRLKEENEIRLQRLNDRLQMQLDDLRSSIASIQPKYQAALNDRGQFEYEAKEALSKSQRIEARFEAQHLELQRVKDRNKLLALELAEARSALMDSNIPEIVRIAGLEETIKKLEAEKEKYERQQQNARNDLEYMRTNYQSASSLAAEHASTNRALESEIEKLREQASANRVKIHEIQRDQEKAGYLRIIKQLKLEKVEVERELDRKSTELAAAMNGRRGMRGQSVPMSPRVLSPMGATNGGNGFGQRGNLGRILQHSRSRGTSPAGVERGAVGGQPQFGELLPGVGSRHVTESSRKG